MAETSASQAPGMADLQRWAEAPSNTLTFPVLSDPGWGISSRFERDNGIPTYSLIGRNMELLIVDGWPSEGQIDAALEEEIPEVAWDEPPDLGEGGGGPVDDGNNPEIGQSSPFGGGQAGLDDNGFVGPFGGSSCTASMAPRPAGWLGLLLIGLVGLLRRR
jgi:MYXO-CTERM domain-containing protein